MITTETKEILCELRDLLEEKNRLACMTTQATAALVKPMSDHATTLRKLVAMFRETLAAEEKAACLAGADAIALAEGREHPLAVLVRRVHGANARWWHNPATSERVERNVGEAPMLVTSELAEALEGHRKGMADAHLPERPSFEVELADAVIRLFDLAGGMGLDLAGAFEAKLAYNSTRHDHTNAARLAAGGKKY